MLRRLLTVFNNILLVMFQLQAKVIYSNTSIHTHLFDTYAEMLKGIYNFCESMCLYLWEKCASMPISHFYVVTS